MPVPSKTFSCAIEHFAICHFCHWFLWNKTQIYILPIDIESLQNRLLKVCYVPATSASLPRVSFFFSFLFFVAAAIDSTNEANKAPLSSLYSLDVYDFMILPHCNRGQQHNRFSEILGHDETYGKWCLDRTEKSWYCRCRWRCDLKKIGIFCWNCFTLRFEACVLTSLK